MISTSVNYREEPTARDIAAVREIVASTGFFNAEEIRVACELVAERLAQGEESGYFFVFAEQAGQVVGYTCYGPIPAADRRYDLYWIAVHDRLRGAGLGRELLRVTEQRIAARGGVRVYAETSSRDQYKPTRHFYQSNGYVLEAFLKDFYTDGDSKVVYGRILGGGV